MRLIPQPEKIEVFSSTTQLNNVTVFEKTDEINNDEAYELIIEPDNITIKASSDKGKHYALVTLKQIKMLYNEIPCMKISDSPRYSYRGFMIDCARHMFSMDALKRMIGVAADLKFNKFHWHLSDDQGFRIELESFPELTEKGSVRKCDTFRNCFSDKEYSGYYTKTQIKEIIDFCKERYIDVIPEFDMPGHQSALLHVFPQFTCSGENVEVKTKQGIFRDIICVGNKEAEECIKKILDELCELFPGDIIHIGGDEVPKHNWKTCEKCRRVMKEHGLKNENELQCLFSGKMIEYLKIKGKKCTVWNDSLKGDNLSFEPIIQYWMHTAKETAERANKGQKLIMSSFNPYYVDYPYGMHPLKAVYAFEPENFKGLTEKGKGNIIGIESPIWTEFITTAQQLEYMCFPRWFAVAETAWSAKENKNYKEFLSACKMLADILRKSGFNLADSNEWNPTPFSRIKKILEFFVPN